MAMNRQYKENICHGLHSHQQRIVESSLKINWNIYVYNVVQSDLP
jgi:hypothetical protein